MQDRLSISRRDAQIPKTCVFLPGCLFFNLLGFDFYLFLFDCLFVFSNQST